MIPAAVVILGITHAYDPDTPAIHEVSCEIQAGAFCCIIGQNGSGKTTLVKHINGLLRPDTGSVTVLGRDTHDVPVPTLAQTIGYCFQNPDHQISRATVREELAFGPQNLGLSEEEVQARVDDCLHTYGLGAWADTPPTMLSMGLRKLVSLAAVAAMRPRIMILDEPTVGLDPGTSQRALEAVEQQRAAGCTIICVTHDIELVTRHASQVVVMHKGEIIADGDPVHVLSDTETLSRTHVTPTQLVRLTGDLDLPIASAEALTIEGFVKSYTDRYTSEAKQ